MRLLWLVVLASAVSCDPDLWRLLRIWRPTPALHWQYLTLECAQAMENFSRGLEHRQQWASLMLDATGQASSQFLQGSTFWLGSLSQCQEINDKYTSISNSSEFPTAVYRVLKLNMNLSEPLQISSLANQVNSDLYVGFRPIWLGVCVPGACGGIADLRSLLEQMLESAEQEQKFRYVELVSIKAIPSDDNTWSHTSTILLILLCSMMLGMAVIGTITDLWYASESNTSGPWLSTLLAFSISRNARAMFSLSRGSETKLTALNGIRVLGMVWIILCHVSIITFIFAGNPSFRERVEKDILYQTISNGTYSVDTFFFLSGILLSYGLLRYEEGKKHDSLLEASRKFCFLIQYRILRLSVPYIFSILMTIFVFRNLSLNSPFELSVPEHINCEQYWWKNLLYINNLFPLTKVCVGWSWYLAADTQLYIVSLFLLLLYRNGYVRVATLGGGVCLFGSWITSAGLSYSLQYIPTVENPFEFVDVIYTKPWVRLGPVWVGVITGWLLCKRNFKLSKLLLVTGWICCILVMIGTIYALIWRELFTTFSSAIYVSLSHTIWTLSIAWILFACVHKRAGWIGSILESPIFAPFGKATYCAYLFHHLLLEWICMNLEGPFLMSRTLMFVMWIGLSVISYMVGFIVSLIFESPILRILSNLRPKENRSNLQPVDLVLAAKYEGVSTMEPETSLSVVKQEKNSV